MTDKLIALADAARHVRSGTKVGIGGGPVMITPIALIREVIIAREVRDGETVAKTYPRYAETAFVP